MRKAIGILATGVVAASALVITADAAPVYEDSPAWDCVTMGNRVCGPTNTQGVAAGCYNDAGDIVALWPCHVVVNPDGSSVGRFTFTIEESGVK